MPSDYGESHRMTLACNLVERQSTVGGRVSVFPSHSTEQRVTIRRGIRRGGNYTCRSSPSLLSPPRMLTRQQRTERETRVLRTASSLSTSATADTVVVVNGNQGRDSTARWGGRPGPRRTTACARTRHTLTTPSVKARSAVAVFTWCVLGVSRSGYRLLRNADSKPASNEIAWQALILLGRNGSTWSSRRLPRGASTGYSGHCWRSSCAPGPPSSNST